MLIAAEPTDTALAVPMLIRFTGQGKINSSKLTFVGKSLVS